ncbi:MAG: hypothetical protein R2734_11590 [Nocardioides sp.]
MEVALTAAALPRLPGFPDGADAVIDLAVHTAMVPSTRPDFFLAATDDDRAATLAAAIAELRAGPAPTHRVHLESRTRCWIATSPAWPP